MRRKRAAGVLVEPQNDCEATLVVVCVCGGRGAISLLSSDQAPVFVLHFFPPLYPDRTRPGWTGGEGGEGGIQERDRKYPTLLMLFMNK